MTLTQLARTRKVLFIEGAGDFKIIRRFARCLGYSALANGFDVIPVETGGFTSWERVAATAWGIERTLGASLHLAAVFDRDYLSDEELTAVVQELSQHLEVAHVHVAKEIENYLLNPSVLQRALEAAVREKSLQSLGSVPPSATRDTLEAITTALRAEVQGQYIAKRAVYLSKTRQDQATTSIETIRWFEQRWENLDLRVQIVPGKTVLRQFRDRVQEQWQVNLTDIRIIDEFRRNEVAPDMLELLERLERFRAAAHDTA